MGNSKKGTNLERGSSILYIDMKHSEKQNDNYYTPEELLEMYPYAKEIGWSKSNVEFLAQEELVVKDKHSDELRILSESFEKILEYHKERNGIGN